MQISKTIYANLKSSKIVIMQIQSLSLRLQVYEWNMISCLSWIIFRNLSFSSVLYLQFHEKTSIS